MTPSTNPINIAAIGCGNRLTHVARLTLQQSPRLKLVGIFDPDPASIDHARQQISPDIKSYKSVTEAVGDSAVEWVMIGSWNRFHAAQAIAALNAGKHVFCEKPLAMSLEDCTAVRDAVRRTGKTFALGLVLRYSPHYQKVRALLDQNKIGRLVSFEFNETLPPPHGGYIFGNWRRRYENAGSHILEKCCHDLDLANWMVGALPIRIASFGGRSIFTPENATLVEQLGKTDKGQSIFEQWPDRHRVDPFSPGADILDNQVVILEYANGVKATFHTNALSAIPERRFYMLGTHGTLRADAYVGEILCQRAGFKTTREDHSFRDNDPHAGGDIVLAEHLAKTILEGAPPLAGVDEGIASAAVAFAIDRAQSTGSVVDLRDTWNRLDLKLQPASATVTTA